MEYITPLPLEETAPEIAKVLISWSQNHPGGIGRHRFLRRMVTIDQIVSGMELAAKTLMKTPKKPWDPNLDTPKRYWGFIRNALNRHPTMLEPKIGRNEPCHCGSEKKFKKCHG